MERPWCRQGTKTQQKGGNNLGKPEAMLGYWGHQCQRHYQARCVGGKCSTRLPAQCGEQTLSIVPKYKHLGNDNFDRVTSLGRSTSRILCYVSLCAVVDKNNWIFARWNVAQIPLLAFARSEWALIYPMLVQVQHVTPDY